VLQADRRKYGAGDGYGAEPDDREPEPDEGGDPPPVSEPAQNEATVSQVDDAVEVAERPIDATHPQRGEIPSSNSQIPTKSQIPNSRSQTSEDPLPMPSFQPASSQPQPLTSNPQGPIFDSPEELEAIKAGYRARLAQVLERVERGFGAEDEPTDSSPSGDDLAPT
jgi:hypothetical protein